MGMKRDEAAAQLWEEFCPSHPPLQIGWFLKEARNVSVPSQTGSLLAKEGPSSMSKKTSASLRLYDLLAVGEVNTVPVVPC